MTSNQHLKLAAFSLCLAVPLLVPLGATVGTTWLSPLVMFGVCPLLGLIIGQENSLPFPGLRRSSVRLAYLRALPRVYVIVWAGTLLWTAAFAARSQPSFGQFVGLIIGIGAASALAICTAHELLHRRSRLDLALARMATSFCLYGHMVVEHLHHHATLGTPEYGATASRGTSAYHFAVSDVARAFLTAMRVERARITRLHLGWWHNRVLQDYSIAAGTLALVGVLWGSSGLILLIGQAAFAVFAFEVITYLHHYGLVRRDGEDPGPHHAWAHHCWLTNSLTFNNTFHADHHLRPRSPYYELHAMHGSPRLPASYFTMFFVALLPPLWYRLIHPRLDALERVKEAGDQQMPEWVRIAQCR